VRVFLNAPVTSPKVRDALHKALGLRGKVAATQREGQRVDAELKEITQDQDRLRRNLREVPADSDVHKRYLKKLDQQETRIEKLQAQLKELRDGAHAQQKEYDAFLANLSVE